MRNEEHKEQCAVLEWWGYKCHSFGVPEHLLFAIPNGGARNAITGAILKAEGVRAGVPDLFLACPNRYYSGLFVEMKKPKGGRVSDAQAGMRTLLMWAGYDVQICEGADKARAVITDYLENR